MRRRDAGVGKIIALALLAATTARAAAPEMLKIDATGCPSADAVAAALSKLLPRTQLSAIADDVLSVDDDDDAFRIGVHGQVSVVVDPKRDCAERALTAAVFAAFVLDPPPTPASPPLPARAIPLLRTPPPRRLHVELELSALFALAPQGTLVTGGGSTRMFVGTRSIGGVIGVTALGPATFDVGLASARLVRVPIDLGLRGTLRRGQVGLSGDLGFVVSPLLVSGLGAGRAYSSAGADVGGRLALSAQLRRWRRVAPFFAVELVATTRHELVVEGEATRETPPLWLGFALGVDASLF